MDVLWYFLALAFASYGTHGSAIATKELSFNPNISAYVEANRNTTIPPHGDDCPGRSSLRHLCLPCKAFVHSLKSTVEGITLLQKSMIQTCSLILHPHSFICKTAMEVAFLLMRHTSSERICQHLLICELSPHRKPTGISLLNPKEAEIVEIFNGNTALLQNSTPIFSSPERKDIIDRVVGEMMQITGTSHLEKSHETSLRSFLGNVLLVLEHYASKDKIP